jgi:hypothetical protein
MGHRGSAQAMTVATWTSLTRDLEFWPGPVNHDGTKIMVRYRKAPTRIAYVSFDAWRDYCEEPSLIRELLDSEEIVGGG